MEMRLRTPVTKGYFFLLGALRLVNAASPRTTSIDKKKISSGTQGTFEAKGRLYTTGKVIPRLFIIDLRTQLVIYGYR